MSQHGTYGIEDTYQDVITDVIVQVKEAFLDEGVDVDVLQQLKQAWETKLVGIGAVSLDGATTTRQRHQPRRQATATSLAIQNAGFPLLGFPAQLRTANIEKSNILQPSALRLVPGTQYAIMERPGGAQNLVLLATAASGQINPSLADIEQPHHSGGGGVHAPIQFVGQPPNMCSMVNTGLIGDKFLHTQQQQQKPITVAMRMEPVSGIGQLPQLDGVGQCRPQIDSGIRAAKMTGHKQLKKSTNTCSVNRIIQLDGGKGQTAAAAPGMTDESSEEDENREEDPTLTAVKYGLAEEHNEGEAEENEEPPLNSGDDQSDDEDLDTLFEADNVVVCQFEKIHRARNKWKFTLKDGVMQIRGKDYCFQKCTGEAEW